MVREDRKILDTIWKRLGPRDKLIMHAIMHSGMQLKCWCIRGDDVHSALKIEKYHLFFYLFT